jgi:hypothetical protein
MGHYPIFGELLALKKTMSITKQWLHIVGVKTCMQFMEPVDEQKFEVNIDVHGTSEGPRLGRHRVINKVALFAIVKSEYSRLVYLCELHCNNSKDSIRQD